MQHEHKGSISNSLVPQRPPATCATALHPRLVGGLRLHGLAVALCLQLAGSAGAQQRDAHIVIRGEGSGKSTASVAGIRHDGSERARLFVHVLRDNLQRSGWFQTVEGPSAGVTVQGEVRGGTGLSVAVTVEWLPNGRFTWSRSGSTDDARPLAHALADEIVQRVLGRPGMASAPILMVGRRAGRTDIYACDADGGRLRRITTDGVLCLSPHWLPDRSGFLYTSYLSGYGAVYQVRLGPPPRRDLVSGRPGLNHTAAPSPDGTLAALVLSFTGTVDLYVLNLATRRLTRLTNTPQASESSPSWSPDGLQLAYVSDVARSPQVYTMHRDAREARRLVFGFSESVSPDWGPDGRIAFCGRQGRSYGIYVVTPGAGAPERVSPNDGAAYEDPSWAPNARHIVATRTAPGGARRLVILDTMGDAPVELLQVEGDWYLADWAR